MNQNFLINKNKIYIKYIYINYPCFLESIIFEI